MKPKFVTCPCGNQFELGTTTVPPNDKEVYDIFSCTCDECGRRASHANCRDGVVHSWSTPAQIRQAQEAYEAQLFDSDMNDFYGRGNW